MRCHDFDAHLEDLLSGVVLPEANDHMRQCERCTSYFRARSAVRNGLRNLASAPLPGPGRATDRAVLAAYRRRQRGAADALPRPVAPAARGAQLLSFPRRASAAMHSYRWWGGAAAAAVAVAVLGSVGMHPFNRLPSAPATASTMAATAGSTGTVAAAPAQSNTLALAQQRAAMTAKVSEPHAAPVARQSAALQGALVASGALSERARRARRAGSRSGDARTELASSAVHAAKRQTAQPVLASAKAPAATQSAVGASSGASSLMHLAAAGDVGQAVAAGAPPVGSTWPGYSNLMYCDPVVCSGPMPVVHIRVPVGQGATNAQSGAQSGAGSGYVNADVVIGPDGVARAIRVAN